jgi:hypothetical protein
MTELESNILKEYARPFFKDKINLFSVKFGEHQFNVRPFKHWQFAGKYVFMQLNPPDITLFTIESYFSAN